MVGEEQPTQHEEHYICARSCGCYGVHMPSAVLIIWSRHFVNVKNHHSSGVYRQMQVTSWSLWISMRNGVLPAERYSPRYSCSA